MQKLCRALGTYLVIWVVGLTAGTVFWLFVALRLIKIEGYWKTWWAIYQGNHALLSNHPTMRDPLFFVLMWWPWCILLPHKFFIWSLPGKNYFRDFMLKCFGKENGREFPEWMYPIFHCVPVERDGSNWREVLRETKSWLKLGRTFVIFGERGRTGSRPRSADAPEVVFIYSEDGSRKIRTIEAALIKAAANAGASFSTVWIDMPFWEEDDSFGLRTWLREWHQVTITFSDSYLPDPELKADALNTDVAQRILTT